MTQITQKLLRDAGYYPPPVADVEIKGPYAQQKLDGLSKLIETARSFYCGFIKQIKQVLVFFQNKTKQNTSDGLVEFLYDPHFPLWVLSPQ